MFSVGRFALASTHATVRCVRCCAKRTSLRAVTSTRSAGIARYFEFYNLVHPHQALGYQTPDAFYRGVINSAADVLPNFAPFFPSCQSPLDGAGNVVVADDGRNLFPRDDEHDDVFFDDLGFGAGSTLSHRALGPNDEVHFRSSPPSSSRCSEQLTNATGSTAHCARIPSTSVAPIHSCVRDASMLSELHALSLRRQAHVSRSLQQTSQKRGDLRPDKRGFLRCATSPRMAWRRCQAGRCPTSCRLSLGAAGPCSISMSPGGQGQGHALPATSRARVRTAARSPLRVRTRRADALTAIGARAKNSRRDGRARYSAASR